MSPSVSPSPSPGYEAYSRGDYAALPGNDNVLETAFNDQDYLDVDTDNGVRVSQSATDEYAIFLFKDYAGAQNSATFTWNGQSDLAPSQSAVYLQIYNQNTTTWEALASNDVADANTDFNLSGNKADLTNYKDSNLLVSCRVYQEAT